MISDWYTTVESTQDGLETQERRNALGGAMKGMRPLVRLQSRVVGRIAFLASSRPIPDFSQLVTAIR